MTNTQLNSAHSFEPALGVLPNAVSTKNGAESDSLLSPVSFLAKFEFSPFSKPLPISLLGSVPVTFNSSVVV